MSGLDWDLIPHTGGLLVNNKNGKVIHQQVLTINSEAQKLLGRTRTPTPRPSSATANGARRSPRGKDRRRQSSICAVMTSSAETQVCV